MEKHTYVVIKKTLGWIALGLRSGEIRRVPFSHYHAFGTRYIFSKTIPRGAVRGGHHRKNNDFLCSSSPVTGSSCHSKSASWAPGTGSSPGHFHEVAEKLLLKFEETFVQSNPFFW